MIEFCAVKHGMMTKIMLNPTYLCLKKKNETNISTNTAAIHVSY